MRAGLKRGATRGSQSRRGAVEPPAPSSLDGVSRARQAAFKLLARREMSEAQIRQALLDRDHAEADVERAIEGLRQQRYLDDPGLAARFARSRLENHGQGRHRIRQTLRKKGVVGPIIEEGIRQALDEVSEGEALERVARRYWAQRKRQPPGRRLRALWAFLLRRGYPAGLVHERLRALWPAWSEALEGLEPLEEE